MAELKCVTNFIPTNLLHILKDLRTMLLKISCRILNFIYQATNKADILFVYEVKMITYFLTSFHKYRLTKTYFFIARYVMSLGRDYAQHELCIYIFNEFRLIKSNFWKSTESITFKDRTFLSAKNSQVWWFELEFL